MEIVVNPGERVEVPNYPGPTYRFKPETESTWPSAFNSEGMEVDVSTFGANDGTDGHLILGPMKETSVLFRNHVLSTDIKVSWDAKTFPYCWVWMVLGGIKEWPLWGKERLITIEPFSSPVISLTDAIANGTALKLGAYESMQTWVSFTVQTSPSLSEIGNSNELF
jgi:hypothetical protein